MNTKLYYQNKGVDKGDSYLFYLESIGEPGSMSIDIAFMNFSNFVWFQGEFTRTDFNDEKLEDISLKFRK